MKSLPVNGLFECHKCLIALISIVLIFPPATATAGSFRCGTKIIITGDSISRLLESCGQPSLKYKAQETIRPDGKRQATGVSNWVYPRGSKKNMVVSIRSGKVVRIVLE